MASELEDIWYTPPRPVKHAQGSGEFPMYMEDEVEEGVDEDK